MPSNNLGEQRENKTLTHPHATFSSKSRGRERYLKPDHIRSAFQRDVHRIAYSQPFRRLRNKTQVFYLPNNDHICTRLEHSIHVANAARTVARALGLNEDLAEAIGLGHDLGHAPFGHHGETILNELCKKHRIAPAFHHEVNSLRQVDRLAQFDRGRQSGLALTWEVRDGIVSHCGEDFTQRVVKPWKKQKDLFSIQTRRDAKNPTTLEGCVVRLVDRVAYAGRDLEDGLQAKLIKKHEIPKEITRALGTNNSEIVGVLIRDIIDNSPNDAEYIAMSHEKFEALKELLQFNRSQIYLTERAKTYEYQAETALQHLYEVFLGILNDTNCFREEGQEKRLPKNGVLYDLQRFTSDLNYTEKDTNERIVIDFLSGFTDDYVLHALDDVFVPKSTA